MLIRSKQLLVLGAVWILLSHTLYAQQQPLVPQAQPIIDGVTVGTGGSFYHGDFDANPANNPIAFMGVAGFNVFATADRAVGPFVLEAGLHYDRLRINTPAVEADFNLVSLDLLLGGARTDIIPDLLYVRPFVGLSPGLQIPNYREVNPDNFSKGHIEDFVELGTRLVLTIPFGLVFQDVVRIGMRVATNDNDLDGFGRGAPLDLVTYFSFGYRFDLLR